MTLRKWVEILPFFIVKKLAWKLCQRHVVHPKDTLTVVEVTDGVFLLLTEKKYREIESKEEEKRKKKVDKARDKLRKILDEYPELEEELEYMIKIAKRLRGEE